MQHVRKWCGYFGAGQPDIRDDDRNGRPSTYRTDVNGEQVGEMILENRQVPIPDLSTASEKYTSSFRNNFDIAKVNARLPKGTKIDVLKLPFHIFNGCKTKETIPETQSDRQETWMHCFVLFF